MNISIPDELHQEMQEVDPKPNWSAIAQAAFSERVTNWKLTNDKGDKMQNVIERLKAAKERESAENYELGKSDGRQLAENWMEPADFRRADAVEDGYFENLYDWAEAVHPELAEDLLDEIEDSDSKRIDQFSDNRYIAGFREGVLQVWDEVKDKI